MCVSSGRLAIERPCALETERPEPTNALRNKRIGHSRSIVLGNKIGRHGLEAAATTTAVLAERRLAFQPSVLSADPDRVPAAVSAGILASSLDCRPVYRRTRTKTVRRPALLYLFPTVPYRIRAGPDAPDGAFPTPKRIFHNVRTGARYESRDAAAAHFASTTAATAATAGTRPGWPPAWRTLWPAAAAPAAGLGRPAYCFPKGTRAASVGNIA